MVALQTRLLVPWPLTLAGSLQERPVGVEDETVKLTVPLNPPVDETVIVEVPLACASMLEGVTGPAETEKSGGTVTVIVALWDNESLVPVMFTRYVPGATLLAAAMLSLDVPEPPVMLAGLGVPVRPVGKEADNWTVPVNPLRGVTVIVED